MTESNLPAAPTRQSLAVKGRSAKGRVTGKLKTAIEAMVWQGLKRDAAAAKAGLTDDGMRKALKKPWVLSAYLAECEVLRLSGRARRLHQLNALATQTENKMAAVAAIKAAEQISDPASATGGHLLQQPGITIVIVGGPGGERRIGPPTLDITPAPQPASDLDIEDSDDTENA
jgi:hypothetical protein